MSRLEELSSDRTEESPVVERSDSREQSSEVESSDRTEESTVVESSDSREESPEVERSDSREDSPVVEAGLYNISTSPPQSPHVKVESLRVREEHLM